MIPKEHISQVTNFGVIHGRDLCYSLINNEPDKVANSKFNFNNLFVCSVIDDYHLSACPLRLQPFYNKIKIIKVDNYVKFTTKIIELQKYITENYNSLPGYIMYVDGADCLILNEIPEPASLLKFYNCKILFNMEPSISGAGYDWVESYISNKFTELCKDYEIKHKQKYKTNTMNSLNAGVFIGEKAYVLEILNETLQIMNDSMNKLFPYGCTNDQLVLAWLFNNHFDKMSIDFFNKFSFWGGKFSFYDDELHQKFKIGYNDQYLANYIESYGTTL